MFALSPRYLSEYSQSLSTWIIWRLSRARYWNIFPQRADFGGDEAQVVGVSGSRSPSRAFRMGTKQVVGGGLAGD